MCNSTSINFIFLLLGFIFLDVCELNIHYSNFFGFCWFFVLVFVGWVWVAECGHVGFRFILHQHSTCIVSISSSPCFTMLIWCHYEPFVKFHTKVEGSILLKFPILAEKLWQKDYWGVRLLIVSLISIEVASLFFFVFFLQGLQVWWMRIVL